MNRFDDSPRDDDSPGGRRLLDDLSRLAPRRPSAELRDRVAAALAEPSPAPSAPSSLPSPSRGRWRWFAERLVWAGGGAVAATLLAGVAAPGRTDVGAGPSGAVPTVISRPTPPIDAPPVTPVTDPPAPGAPDAVDGLVDAPRDDDAAPAEPPLEPVAEESLAWSDEGVRYLADGVPARIYRHWVLERHPEPSGRESLLPREDVFVVPVSLR